MKKEVATLKTEYPVPNENQSKNKIDNIKHFFFKEKNLDLTLIVQNNKLRFEAYSKEYIPSKFYGHYASEYSYQDLIKTHPIFSEYKDSEQIFQELSNLIEGSINNKKEQFELTLITDQIILQFKLFIPTTKPLIIPIKKCDNKNEEAMAFLYHQMKQLLALLKEREETINKLKEKINSWVSFRNKIKEHIEATKRNNTQIYQQNIQLEKNTADIKNILTYLGQTKQDTVLSSNGLNESKENKETKPYFYNEPNSLVLAQLSVTPNYIDIPKYPQNYSQNYTQINKVEYNYNGKNISYMLVLSNGELLSGTDDGKIIHFVKENISFKIKKTVETQKGSILFLFEMNIQNNILASTEEKVIQQWNISTYQLLRTFEGHSGWVGNVKQLSNGKIISCSHDKTIKIWNPNGDCIFTVEAHSKAVLCLHEIKQNLIVSGSHDSNLKFWEYKQTESNITLELIKTLKDVYCNFNECLYFNKKENKLIAGGEGEIKIINLENYSIEKTITEGLEDKVVWCITQLQNENYLIGYESEKDQLMKYNSNLEEGEIIPYEIQSNIFCLKCLNEKEFISGDGNGNIILWKY